MTRISQIAQLVVSIAVVGLFWLIYPGVMVIFASTAGLVYVSASVLALRGNALAIRVAFTLSLATAVITIVAVLRFVGNGFRYWSGNFEAHDGIYWPPYAFATIAIGATLVVALQVMSWRSEGASNPQS